MCGMARQVCVCRMDRGWHICGVIYCMRCGCMHIVFQHMWCKCVPGGVGSELWSIMLCKKESQLQSKKTDFSQEKSRKSQKKVKKIDFSLTFLD